MHDFRVGDGVFSLKVVQNDWQSCDLSGLSLQDKDCDFEMGNNFVWLNSKDGVCVKEVVLKAFSDSDLGWDFVLKGPH